MDVFATIGAEYLGTTLDTAFYGVYATLFMLFIGIHRYRGKKFYKGVPNIAMIVLFVLCTIFWTVDVAIEFYSLENIRLEETNILATVFTVVYGLIDLTTQIILIYRCWIIWHRRYIVVVLPLILAICSMGAYFFQIRSWCNIGSNTPTVCVCVVSGLIFNFNDGLISVIQALGELGFASSLAVNVSVTALIVGRIWKLSKEFEEINQSPDRPYNIIIAMVLESGLVVAVAQLIWLVLFTLHDIGYPVISGAITELYAITPTILMIRVALGTAYDSETKLGSTILFQRDRQQTQELTEIAFSATKSQNSKQNFNDPEVNI
ncbi:hypothetical protein M422DRAFT_257146 [Sphaerobolus stellatus SS14]|uniref:Chitin synthase export chaperone n=1 Tax=Sphaerobolus stellatus (strain SS14) TaxID=990650 RepID=A0A0C9UAC0_SPHS4|nr:hypothetical protein M422DRAFT_257146 [Sphaerobolus stellatus SS14]